MPQPGTADMLRCAVGSLARRLSGPVVCAKIDAIASVSEGTPMDAKTAEARTHEFDAEDVEYLRHGDKPLLATVFRPRGPGPFPALVEVHGGAWCMSDRKTERVRHEAMASRGIVSVALDFR